MNIYEHFFEHHKKIFFVFFMFSYVFVVLVYFE